MSNFERAWSTGLSDGEKATGSKLTLLDENVAKSANFSEGSEHEPTSPVIVGGSGIQAVIAAGSSMNALPTLNDVANTLYRLPSEIHAQSDTIWQESTFGWKQIAVTAQGELYADFLLSAGDEVTDVIASVKGATHSAWPIEYPPIVYAYMCDLESPGTGTSLGTPTAYIVTQTAYENWTTIWLPDVDTDANRIATSTARLLRVLVKGEYGTNAVANMDVQHVKINGIFKAQRQY